MDKVEFEHNHRLIPRGAGTAPRPRRANQILSRLPGFWMKGLTISWSVTGKRKGWLAATHQTSWKNLRGPKDRVEQDNKIR